MKIKKKTKNDILVRALKTFLQGFLAALAATPIIDLGDNAALKSALIAAFAGGISALMNWLSNYLGGNEDE